MDKQKIQSRQIEILDLVKEFCSKKIDDEYYSLATKLILKLSKKKNVPFLTGKPEVWAVAIIHALGTINFLFDKSFEPYVSIDELNCFFGTSKSTTGNKSKQIRDLLKLEIYDEDFSTKAVQKTNPFNDLVLVDGLWVSLDMLPEQFQQKVKQARNEGKDISFTTR
jgi:hypothetical protein